MRLQDLHMLPKFRDSLSYLYVEHGRLEQDDKSVALWNPLGKTQIPCASLACSCWAGSASATPPS